jgi:predicted dehydrogenase
MSDLDFQVRHFHAFLWASGGNYSDFYIHHIDHLSWMKNGWPVKAQGVGGRHYKGTPDGTPFIDQNFDAYAVEYTFADGSKFYFEGRHMPNTLGIYSSYLHGSKGSGIVSAANDVGFPSSLYKSQIQTPANLIWQSKDTSNPYQNEWDRLVDAIRKDKPYNEVKRGVEASVATSMGRAATHTGQEITFDEMLNSDHEFAPGLDKLTKDSPAPLIKDAKGYYPRPMPGQKGKREY